MNRLIAALALTLFLVPLGCDDRVTDPLSVDRQDSKIPVVGGVVKGAPPQIVTYFFDSTVPTSPHKMMLWEIGSSSFTPVDLNAGTGWPFAAPGDWSANGSQLAFWVGIPGLTPGAPPIKAEIAVMGLAPDGTPDFSSFTLVTDDVDEDSAPAWSPNGKMLAWSCQDRTRTQSTPYKNTAICVSEYHPATGWGPKVQLTADQPGYTTLYYTESGPSWSPKNDKLIFSRMRVGCDRPGQDPCPPNSNRWDLWTYDLATGTETNETQSDWADEEDPSWHPKDPKNLIAFQVYVDDDSYDIYQWRLGTPIASATPLIASSSRSERSPWWTSTGQQLTFTEGFNHEGRPMIGRPPRPNPNYPRPLTDVSIVDATGLNYANLTNTPLARDWFGRVRPK